MLTNMYPDPERPWYGCFVRDQVLDIRALGLDATVVLVNGRRSRREYYRAVGSVRRAVAALRPDVVHAHYGLTGAIGMTQRAAPLITTFYGSDCSGHIRWQKAVSWLVARRSWPIFVSAGLALSVGLPDASVIPTPVDTEVFQPVDRTEARGALGWKRAGLYALLPGSRTAEVKDSNLFDQTLVAASSMGCEIVGKSLESMPRHEVALAMSAVDVTLMTSRFEGSPVAVKESLACMTPVVSVPVGDVGSIIEGLPGCAVVPRDPIRLAEALVSAIEHGRSSVLRSSVERFSRPNIARLVVEQYERLLSWPGHD